VKVKDLDKETEERGIGAQSAKPGGLEKRWCKKTCTRSRSMRSNSVHQLKESGNDVNVAGFLSPVNSGKFSGFSAFDYLGYRLRRPC
jgi:hypothetical protein